MKLNKTKIRSILFSIVCLLAIALSITAMVFGMLYCNNVNSLHVADAAEPVQQGLKFNQLFAPVNLRDTFTSNNVTWTNHETYMSLSGQIIYGGWDNFIGKRIILNRNHKYYFTLNMSKNLANFGVYVYESDRIATLNSSNNFSAILSNVGGIISANVQADAYVTTNCTLSPIVVDLTEMFGDGKEPKTLEDVQKYFVPGTYYPYTPIVDYDKLIVDARKDGYNKGYNEGITYSQELFKYYSHTIVSDTNKDGGFAVAGNLLTNEFEEPIVKRVTWHTDSMTDGPHNIFIIPIGDCIVKNLDGVNFPIPLDLDYLNINSQSDYWSAFFIQGEGFKPKSKYVLDIRSDVALVNYYFKNLDKRFCMVEQGANNTTDPCICEFFNFNQDNINTYLTGTGDAYQIGYDDGYSSGTSDGYNDGHSIGYNTGRADGYKAGVEGKNSFSDLANAIVMVPVSGITSLFNFELFGFNVADLVLALLTMCIVFGIINLIMARRG